MIIKNSILILLFFCFFSINNSFAEIDEYGYDYDDHSWYTNQTNDTSITESAQTGDKNSEGDITGTGFMIDTSGSLFNFGNNSNNSLKQGTSTQTINNTLGTIIQKLMIALGFISAFIMTIGAGYMILYHGQDEFLTKGKNIFMAGIISLVVALASYQLVSFIRFILYS